MLLVADRPTEVLLGIYILSFSYISEQTMVSRIVQTVGGSRIQVERAIVISVLMRKIEKYFVPLPPIGAGAIEKSGRPHKAARAFRRGDASCLLAAPLRDVRVDHFSYPTRTRSR